MAGIYIHIPFCLQKCHYCDFYRSTDFGNRKELLDCIKKEIDLKSKFLDKETVDTIYIGGGTPSVLELAEISELLESLEKNFIIDDKAEITMEANPDDLSAQYLKKIKQKTRINRLSIGIQSFDDEHLRMMNRRHDSNGAIQAIQNSIKYGFDNISIDLIYGLPGMTIEKWEKNLKTAFSFDIKHLSAYHLTYEPGTVFHHKLKRGIIKKNDEEESLAQFNQLIDYTKKNNFIHYEISNFALEDFYSRHNSNYWLQKKYLGLGPSAHSYDLNSRHWNISNNNEYIKRIKEERSFYKTEILDENSRYNEYIITRLRTIWGVDANVIKEKFGFFYFDYFKRIIEKFKADNLVEMNENMYKLTKKGIFISDYIISELLAVEK